MERLNQDQFVGNFENLEPGEPDTIDTGIIRKFSSGATRDTAEDKFDYEGFLSPAVLEAFASYMHFHRKQSDGSLRASDNWQAGIPVKELMKSLLRHVVDVWLIHRGYNAQRTEKGQVVTVSIMDALCGIIFNTFAYMHHLIQEKRKCENNSDQKTL